MSPYLKMMVALGVSAVVAAVAGYFVGSASQPSQAEAAAAKKAGFTSTYESSKSSAYRPARADAFDAGSKSGRIVAARIGASRGLRAGEKAQAQADAATQAKKTEEAQSRPCVQVDSSSSDCQYLGPGSGYGPCPAGSVPNADGGVVCVKLNE